MPFTFTRPESLPDVVVVVPKVFGDERGWFAETYKESDFAGAGITGPLRQSNQSRSRRGVIRGLHYQIPPMAQGKLVRCVTGEILDVALDIRKGSPTYGRWYATALSAEDHRMLWIPEGFAHGLVARSEIADVVYQTTAESSAPPERGIRWDDPAIGVDWGLRDPIVSARDAALPLLADADSAFSWR